MSTYLQLPSFPRSVDPVWNFLPINPLINTP
jgi:hypothetical protein